MDMHRVEEEMRRAMAMTRCTTTGTKSSGCTREEDAGAAACAPQGKEAALPSLVRA